jgi:hypothetical protein
MAAVFSARGGGGCLARGRFGGLMAGDSRFAVERIAVWRPAGSRFGGPWFAVLRPAVWRFAVERIAVWRIAVSGWWGKCLAGGDVFIHQLREL